MNVYSLRAPTGYKCLGHIAVADWNEPDLNKYRCVRDDYVQNVYIDQYPKWQDRGSGAHLNFAAYWIRGTSLTIDMGLYWSEASYRWPRTKAVPALKIQSSVICVKNC